MTAPAPGTPRPDAFMQAVRQQIVDTPLPSGHRGRPHGRGGRRRGLARPLPLAGAGMVLAAAIAALVIALGASGGDPAPAYAVTLDNHTVTIYWRQWRDVGSLNARLRALRVRIRVVPIIRGCVAPVHHVIYAHSGVPTHVAPGPARTLKVAPARSLARTPMHGPRSQGGTLTTWNDTLPGRTRIFIVSRSGWAGDVFTVVGPAPRCVGEGASDHSASSPHKAG